MCALRTRGRCVRLDSKTVHAQANQQAPQTRSLRTRGPRRSVLIVGLVVMVGLIVGFLSHTWWLPKAAEVVDILRHGLHGGEGNRGAGLDERGDQEHGDQEHGDLGLVERSAAEQDPAGHDHGESPQPDSPPYDHEHDEATALRMSKQAEANLGGDLYRVKLQPFARTINVPATVVRRPGRSQVQIAAPFTGLVAHIYRAEGEAVTPGMPLFDVQLTHEELVDAQAEFLRIAEELDVVQREVARVAKVAANGAIAGKALLARQYEQQKLEASFHAYRQRLLLHRLTPEQVDGILENRELLQDFTVAVPLPEENGQGTRLMQVQELKVEKGQHVAAGDSLCTLADHATLYVEGKAFEQDIPPLAAAAHNGWTVTAVFQSADSGRRPVPNLQILYLDNEIDIQSRAFCFYVTLPNELVRDTKSEAGPRFIDWRFKPGQRLRLLVPVEASTQRIVLPVEAVVRDGAESYVFEHNQDHFDRRSVQVDYRDQDRVVIAKDGGLKLGVQVAVSGAYQVHLATKNKEGTGMDPHAGHQH